jgi:hypothetical protein
MTCGNRYSKKIYIQVRQLIICTRQNNTVSERKEKCAPPRVNTHELLSIYGTTTCYRVKRSSTVDLRYLKKTLKHMICKVTD